MIQAFNCISETALSDLIPNPIPIHFPANIRLTPWSSEDVFKTPSRHLDLDECIHLSHTS